jgi:hypothetical protein
MTAPRTPGQRHPVPASVSTRTDDPLANARRIARLLDSAVGVPGTRVRFGLDALLGVVPGLGDVAGAAMSGYLVLLGSRLGVSRAVLMRMISNVAVDAAGGALPIVGDLFDVGWKANTRNFELLERSIGGGPTDAAGRPRTKPANKLFVAGAILVLVLLAVGSILAAWFLLRAIAGAVSTGR